MTRKFVLTAMLIGFTLPLLPFILSFKTDASARGSESIKRTQDLARSAYMQTRSANLQGKLFPAKTVGVNRNALTELFIPTEAAHGRTGLMPALGLTFTVNSTVDAPDAIPGDGVCADEGEACNLRAAIQEANATPGLDTIAFNIDISGVVTIAPLTPLPNITDPVVINGYSQPGASPNTLAAGNNAVLLIELSGTNAGVASGLTVTSGLTTVRGLIINSFTGDGIVLSGNSGNVVEGNFIGTDSTGSVDLGNGASGIRIQNQSAANLIGGQSLAGRNIISGNNGNGIFITGTGSDDNEVTGNFIGTNISGNSPLGNSLNGISISGSFDNTVGGSAPNTIAFNALNGVLISFGNNNVITGNSIFSNSALGIDLNPAGPTPNDACDSDAGANNAQNFPLLTSATSGPSSTLIQGTLNSAANTTFVIEFFASPACDSSGFGEGQTFIGSTNVSTDTSCNAVINATLPNIVPSGSVITATAIDPSGNTSEFSQCITAAATGACVITCPANITVGVETAQCGANVNYPFPTVSGSCFLIFCNPQSGSFFPVGTTTITCSEIATPELSVPLAPASCSFTVTVIDNIAPSITCPANISVTPSQGQRSIAVDYPAPVVTDNCRNSFGTDCNPPSGASFPVGTTTVTCVVVDAGGNSSSCSFTVTVADTQLPTIVCPGNVVVQGTSQQCTAVVSFPEPNITGSPAGTVVACVPPSGSTFPVGTTAITCAATTPAGLRATCGLSVTVNGSPQARLMLENNKPALEFGPTQPVRKPKKRPKNCDCSETFMIENTGCGVLGLDLDSIMRTGSDVDSGRITDPDDSGFFSVVIINPDGTERPAICTTGVSPCIRINPGQKLTFRVDFKPVIPAAFSGRTRGLAASEVVPDTITSKITFNQSGGAPLVINIVGRVSPELRLIDPDNPRKTKRVILERSGNEFIVTYAVFDSDLDANRTRFEFLDNQNRLIGQPIDVDLTGPIRDGNLVRGQSFVVVQNFTGARDNPEVASVRVTVFDPESSDTATGVLSSSSGAASIRSQSRARSIILFPPRAMLNSSF